MAGPSAPPIKGPPPDGDVDKGPIMLAITYVTTFIALFFVALRMFVRIKVVKSIGWDDYVLLVAAALAVLVLVWKVMAVNHGYGRHQYYLSEYDKLEASKYARFTVAPNLIACTLARISFCIFLLRIVGRNRLHKIFLWSVIGITSATTIATAVNVLASCKPFEKMWNPAIKGDCGDPNRSVVMGLVQAVSVISADFCLAIFPIIIIRKLNMAVKTKIALGVLMGMGLFVGIACLVKTKEIRSLASRPRDVTWNTFTLTAFSIVEQNIGIIAVSAPACRPLFSRFFKIGSSYGNGGAGAKANPYVGFEGRGSYSLGNMSGRKKGPLTYPNAVHVTSSSNRKPMHPELDDNGSESSLVTRGGGLTSPASQDGPGNHPNGIPGTGNGTGNNGGQGITKTVSVSLHTTKMYDDDDDDDDKEKVFRLA